MPNNKGRIGNWQFKWLKNELKEAKTKTHIFVFMHRPLLSVMNPKGVPWKHQAFVDQKNEAKLIQLLTAYQVDIVFAGHEHFFNQQKQAGVTYIITAPAGSAPYSDSKHGGFPHFVKVNIDGEKLDLKVFGLEKVYNPDQILKPTF
jgi:3',5'-cyclic AMP phosphodiesterase CpdA